MKQKWNDISPWCWTCATRHSKLQREMNAWKSCICTSVCSVWLEMLCEILQPRGTQSKEAVLSLTTGCVTCFCFWALVSPCRWTFIPHIPSTVFKSMETLCFSVQCSGQCLSHGEHVYSLTVWSLSILLCCDFSQMDDIDAMFSDLLGEMDLLTQVSSVMTAV